MFCVERKEKEQQLSRKTRMLAERKKEEAAAAFYSKSYDKKYNREVLGIVMALESLSVACHFSCSSARRRICRSTPPRALSATGACVSTTS